MSSQRNTKKESPEAAPAPSPAAASAPGLRVAPSPVGGYGVFAARSYSKGEMVECCRIVECDANAIGKTPLQDYVFGSHRKDTVLVVLGYGSLYNHAPDANLRYETTQDGTMRFFARRAIRSGAELTIDYGKNWWGARLRSPLQASPRRQAPPLAEANLRPAETYSPGMRERDLLLRVCRRTDPADVEELLGQPLDWRLVVTEAARNGVVPLLFSALKDRASVPEPARAELLSEWTKNAARNLLLASVLVEILDALEERAVPALAYKGPALAILAYGSVAMRCFGDLDIIVPRTHVAAAKAALETQGYACTLSPREEARYLRERYHLHFGRDEHSPDVEIHWAITPAYWPFPLSAERLWSSDASVEVAGARIPTLDREMSLLAICAHGAKERWPRLGMICDLAGLLERSPDLDWEWIERQASASKRARVLLLGLWLGASLLDAPVPDNLLAQARADRVVLAVAAEIEEHLFGNDPIDGLHFHRYAWRIWNQWPDRIGYLQYAMAALPAKIRGLLRPTEIDGSLPAGLAWLWRPVRVIWRSRDDLGRLLRQIANNL